MEEKLNKFITNPINLRDRLRYVLNEHKSSVFKIAEGDVNRRVKMQNQINGSTTISADTIEFILQTFKDISAEWLLRGEGPMYVKDIKDWKIYTQGGDVISASGGSSVNTGAQTESPTTTNKDDDTTLRELLDIEREHYREMIKDKDKIIADKDKIIADKDDDIKQLRLEKNDMSTKLNLAMIKIIK